MGLTVEPAVVRADRRDWLGHINLALLGFASSSYGLFVYSREIAITLSDVVLAVVVALNCLIPLTRLRLRVSVRLRRTFAYSALGLGLILVGQLVSLVSNARSYPLAFALSRGSLLFGLLQIGRGALVLFSFAMVYHATVKDARSAVIGLRSLVGVLVISVLWSMFRSYVLGFPSAPVTVGTELFHRIRGFQPEPSMFGPVLAAGIFVCLALLVDGQGRRGGWFWAISLPILGIGFMLSYSTLAILSGLAGAVTFSVGLIAARRFRSILYAGFLLAAVFVLVLAVSIISFAPASASRIFSYAVRPVGRIADPEDYSVRYRLSVLPVGLRAFASNWLVGVGTGRLGVVLHDFADGPLQTSYALTMNSYLDLLAESGVIAGLGVLVLSLALLRLFLFAARFGNRAMQALPIGLVAGSVAGLVSWAGVDNFLHFYTWFLLGIATGWKGYPRELSRA